MSLPIIGRILIFLKKDSVASFSLAGFGGYGGFVESGGLQEVFACSRERMLDYFIDA